MKQVTYRGSTNSRHRHTKCTHHGNLVPQDMCTPALTILDHLCHSMYIICVTAVYIWSHVVHLTVVSNIEWMVALQLQVIS